MNKIKSYHARHRIRGIVLLLAGTVLLSAFSGCGAKEANPAEVRPEVRPEQIIPEEDKESYDNVWAEKTDAAEIEKVGMAMEQDAFDRKFLEYMSEHTQGNYMTSPLSFRYALGLLLAGAEGSTKTELLKALGVETEEEWVKYCLNFNGFVKYFEDGLAREIETNNEYKKQGWMSQNTPDPFRALRVANSVWKAEGIQNNFKDAYKNAVERNYAAEYRSFTPENAVAKINEWADIKTEHMIPELLPKSYPTEQLAVVLMNALYFKDPWQEGFSESLTREGDFRTYDGKTVKKEFMTTKKNFSYYEDGDTQLVILPMKGGVYMAFVLGSTDGLSRKIAKATSEEVNVTIPKIDLESDFSNGELVNFLKGCGVNLAFDSNSADFSAMIGYPVYVDDIIQKTRIKLDEDGVEAAAVTAMMMKNTSFIMPKEPKNFVADRPFSFYIYTTCNDTTAMMFAGEIVE